MNKNITGQIWNVKVDGDIQVSCSSDITLSEELNKPKIHRDSGAEESGVDQGSSASTLLWIFG